LGALAALVAFVWAAILYVRALIVVTDFDYGRAIVSVMAPGAVLGLLALLGIVASLAATVRMAIF
jgi:apolipoprotein N-acyltransferase